MEIEEEKEPTQPHLIPEEIKWSIIFLKKSNLSHKAIARGITQTYNRSISHQTVKRIWIKYEETGNVASCWNIDGRPKALSEEDLERLIDNCREYRTLSVKERKEELDLEASRATINKALLDHGFKAYKARKKPPLTPGNIEARLSFAEDQEFWSEEDWYNIIFTDECAFRLTNSNGRVFIRRTEEELWEEDIFQPHIPQSRTVMVWGAISIDGAGPLVRLEGNINSEDYLNIFRQRLRRYYPELYGGHLVFQQDNAPIHTARAVTDWFRSKDILVLGWPARSPDLNIIENVWGRIKYELRDHLFEDLDDLWEEIQRLWHELITDEFVINLYNSLPRRMEAVIRANGRHTKY